MQADYGFAVTQSGDIRSYEVDKHKSVQSASKWILFLTFAVAGSLLASLIHKLPAFLGIVFVVFAIWMAIKAFSGSGSSRFSLHTDRLVFDGDTYNKADVRNLCIRGPNDVIVSGRNNLEAASYAQVARVAQAENFSVTFDYGKKVVWLCRHLTEPQAEALFGDLSKQLAA